MMQTGLWWADAGISKGKRATWAFPYDDIIPRLREELDRIINERGDVAGTATGGIA